MTRSPDAGRLDPRSYRPDFPILSTTVHGVPLVYLDNAATTQRPRQVIQAMVDSYEQTYANVHRGIHWLAEQSTALYEGARDKVRDFLHARAREEVVFTSGATAGINLVARSWGDANIRRGDEILVTQMEHHSNLVPWFQLAERRGAVVRHIPVTDDGRLALDWPDRLLTERTRLVAVTAVSNVLGTVNPVEEIVRRAHEAGSLVLVDGAQSVPHQETDVQRWDCDFLAFSGHKMLGPSGIGVLYGKRDLLEAMPPFLGGGSMIRDVTLEGFSRPICRQFEAGTPPIVQRSGWARPWTISTPGHGAIHEHERRLTGEPTRCWERFRRAILGPERPKRGHRGFTMVTLGPREPP